MSDPAPDAFATFGVLHTFRFEVILQMKRRNGATTDLVEIRSAFSECTGLEGTMEQKVIKEGGRNWGAVQRAGMVTFATVILKRGITPTAELANWFTRVAKGEYAERADVKITLRGPPADAKGTNRDVFVYTLTNALPVKFKAADFNARATEVGIEELHLVHEGLSLEKKS